MAAALGNFKATVWSAIVIEALRKSLIFGARCNQDYEGEAKVGGQVKVNEIGDITVGTYTAHSDMTFETLDGAQLTMKIDQQKYFAFQLDQTDKVFTNPGLMEKFLSRAVYKVRDTMDQYVAGLWEDGGVLTDLGTSGTPLDVSAGNIVSRIGLVGRTMSDANIPEEGRWMVAKPWFYEDLWNAEIELENVSGNQTSYTNGIVGRVRGITLFESNNVDYYSAAGTDDKFMAGNDSAIALALAIDGDVRMKEAEKRRAENVDGLFVYGAKVIRPDNLAVLTAAEA